MRGRDGRRGWLVPGRVRRIAVGRRRVGPALGRKSQLAIDEHEVGGRNDRIVLDERGLIGPVDIAQQDVGGAVAVDIAGADDLPLRRQPAEHVRLGRRLAVDGADLQEPVAAQQQPIEPSIGIEVAGAGELPG